MSVPAKTAAENKLRIMHMLLLTGEAFAHIIVHGEDFVGRVYGRDSAFLVYLYINFG